MQAVLFDMYNTLMIDENPESRSRYLCDAIYTQITKAQYPLSFPQLVEAYRDAQQWAEALEGQAPYPCITPLARVSRLLGNVGVSGDWVLERQVLDIFHSAVLQFPLALSEGCREALRFVKEQGWALGLICNTGRSSGLSLRFFLKSQGVFSYFDDMVFSDEYGFRKPNPGIFLHALRRMGVTRPEQAVFIGDHLDWDVRGAESIGMLAKHFTYQTQTLDRLVREIC